MPNKGLHLTQQYLKKHPKELSRFTRVFIWSDEWQFYWRDEGQGYTQYRNEAGMFPINEAWERIKDAGPEKKLKIIDIMSHHDPLAKHHK